MMRASLLACLALVAAPAISRAAPPGVPWQWDAATPDLFPRADLAVTAAGATYRLALVTARHQTHLELTSGSWTVTPSGDSWEDSTGAALATDGQRIYLVTYNHADSGGTLAAYATRDGARLWSVRLAAVGPVGHSKYFNRVQLRLIGGAPVVFGSEGAGRYVEVRDPRTGQLVANRTLPAQYPMQPLAEGLFYELEAQLASHRTYEVGVDDFLARHVMMKGTDRAARVAAFREAARRLDGTPLQHGRFHLAVRLVDTGRKLAVVAERQ